MSFISITTSCNHHQLLILMQLAAASYVFEVRLHTYSNPNHRDRDGDCESLCFSNCDCDNQFTFCLRHQGGSRSTDTSSCSLGGRSQRTGVFDSNDFIIFNSNLGNGVSNPLVYTGNSWPVSKL